MKIISIRKIILVITTLFITQLVLCSINSVESTVISGYISVYFPSDFPTAIKHPIGYESYLLEGMSHRMFVHFTSYSGTGSVTVKASSDAFTGDSMLTKEVSEEDKSYIFELTFSLKTGIDGSYVVNVEARNELGNIIDTETVTIRVWSNEHKEAADILYKAQILVGYYPYGVGILGPRYEAPEARANFTLALSEFTSAMLSYDSKEWADAKTHAENTINYINKAELAERKFIEGSANSKVAHFLDLIMYPSIVIAILLIIYIVAAIFRKIKPASK